MIARASISTDVEHYTVREWHERSSMPLYHLPNHSSSRSNDPLGICTDGQEDVNHQQLLKALLMRADKDFEQLNSRDETSMANVQAFVAGWTRAIEGLLQDIAYSLHADHSFNADGLRELHEGMTITLADRRRFQQNLFSAAWQLDAVFSDGILPQLAEGHRNAAYSTAEMDAILAHMFLGTLRVPDGNTWGRPGFTQYLDGKILPVARQTALPYLQTIFKHFAQGGYKATVDASYRFRFYFSQAYDLAPLASSRVQVPRFNATFVEVPTDPSRKSAAFVLVAANAQPGPGPGGTHEERLVGQSPALAIISLLCPVLPPEVAIITNDIPVHAAWQGHGRTAKLVGLYPPDDRPSRRYIIADALPLDLSHKMADLRPGNVEREVRKLCAVFCGAKKTWTREGRIHEDMRIELPPWGCGAFGGSLTIKAPCMMMAAGLANLASENLELLVTPDRQQEITKVQEMQQHLPTLIIQDLYASLMAQK